MAIDQKNPPPNPIWVPPKGNFMTIASIVIKTDDNSGLYKARITDSKIKLAFRRTAVFSTNFHQQVTLYTVTWGRNVELVLGGSKKRPTLNTFCGTILDNLLQFKKTKRVCIMI